jgi:hypothetical protein
MMDSCSHCIIRHGPVVSARSEWLKTSPLSGPPPHTVADSYCRQKYLFQRFFYIRSYNKIIRRGPASCILIAIPSWEAELRIELGYHN